MFGPDKCGEDYKLHFIFRHKNLKTGEYEEKHAKKPDADLRTYYTDKKTHLYTLGETTHSHTADPACVWPICVVPQCWTLTTHLRFWWIRLWWTVEVCCLTWPLLSTPLLRLRTLKTINLKTGMRGRRSRTPLQPNLMIGKCTQLVTMEMEVNRYDVVHVLRWSLAATSVGTLTTFFWLSEMFGMNSEFGNCFFYWLFL